MNRATATLTGIFLNVVNTGIGLANHADKIAMISTIASLVLTCSIAYKNYKDGKKTAAETKMLELEMAIKKKELKFSQNKEDP